MLHQHCSPSGYYLDVDFFLRDVRHRSLPAAAAAADAAVAVAAAATVAATLARPPVSCRSLRAHPRVSLHYHCHHCYYFLALFFPRPTDCQQSRSVLARRAPLRFPAVTGSVTANRLATMPIPPRCFLAVNGSHLTRWRGPCVWPLGGNGAAKVVVLVQLGRGKRAATLGKQVCQTQAFACAVIPSAICIPTQDVRFEWQTSCPNKLAFAANGWLAFAAVALAFVFGHSVNHPVVSSILAALLRATLAQALAELEIILVASELRVEQSIGDLALPSLPPTLQLNQFPLVFFQQVMQYQ